MKRTLSLLLLLAVLVTALVLPAQATALGHVTDAAALLTEEEWSQLETLCGQISQEYNCGVYIVTVEDFTDYGSGDVFEVTYELYHQYALGMGPDRNGLILLLSMADRDFALFVYGDEAEYAFNGDGQLALEEQFLPWFRENDWYGGFRAYAETCGEFLALAAAGEPVRVSPGPLIAVAVVVSFLLALAVVGILRIGMKNVRRENQANRYVTGKLELTARRDQFTHKTQTRRKIQSSSGGSKARVGGGGSGRTGKF